MKYVAILFATDAGSGQTLTCSDEVDTDDKEVILAHMMKFAKLTERDDVDTILLVRNGETHPWREGENAPEVGAPEVFKHWTGGGGDFDSDEDTDTEEDVGQTDEDDDND